MAHAHSGSSIDQHTLVAVAAEGESTGTGLTGAPLAAPVFFAAWAAVGAAIGLGLACRGHHRRTMIALGVGLGPLMALIASEAVRRREPTATGLELAQAVDHGGPFDVLVIVPGNAEHVRSVVPSLLSVRPNLGTLTLGRVVEYEWIEGDLDNEVVADGLSRLTQAEELVPVAGAGLALLPGTIDAVVKRFGAQHAHPLVLFAVDESGPGLHAPEHW